MKKNRWQQLKYDNENKQWKLEPENQETLEKIIRFLYHEKVGAMESELIRRDLISMAQEAEKNGEKFQTEIEESRKEQDGMTEKQLKRIIMDEIKVTIQKRESEDKADVEKSSGNFS